MAVKMGNLLQARCPALVAGALVSVLPLSMIRTMIFHVVRNMTPLRESILLDAETPQN
jgi:hypothetical protein